MEVVDLEYFNSVRYSIYGNSSSLFYLLLIEDNNQSALGNHYHFMYLYQ